MSFPWHYIFSGLSGVKLSPIYLSTSWTLDCLILLLFHTIRWRPAMPDLTFPSFYFGGKRKDNLICCSDLQLGQGHRAASSKPAWTAAICLVHEPTVLQLGAKTLQPDPTHHGLWGATTSSPVSVGKPSSRSCPAASRWKGQPPPTRSSPCALRSRYPAPRIFQ